MILSSEILEILEIVAAILGLINIALLIFRNHWNYGFGIASVGLLFFVFWEKKIYADSVLQLFYIPAQAWGWYLWL